MIVKQLLLKLIETEKEVDVHCRACQQLISIAIDILLYHQKKLNIDVFVETIQLRNLYRNMTDITNPLPDNIANSIQYYLTNTIGFDISKGFDEQYYQISGLHGVVYMMCLRILYRYNKTLNNIFTVINARLINI